MSLRNFAGGSIIWSHTRVMVSRGVKICQVAMDRTNRSFPRAQIARWHPARARCPQPDRVPGRPTRMPTPVLTVYSKCLKINPKTRMWIYLIILFLRNINLDFFVHRRILMKTDQKEQFRKNYFWENLVSVSSIAKIELRKVRLV